MTYKLRKGNSYNGDILLKNYFGRATTATEVACRIIITENIPIRVYYIHMKSKPIRIIIFVLALQAAAALFWGMIEAKIITVRPYTVSSPEIGSGLDGMKIVLLTDIHVGKHTSMRRLNRTIGKIRKLGPDIVLLGGDYLYHYFNEYEEIFRPFAALSASVPVFAVSGNHDDSRIMAAADAADSVCWRIRVFFSGGEIRY